MKAFVGGKIFLGRRFEEGFGVIFDEKIVKIVPEKEVEAREISDLRGKYLVPGFIDVHVHGFLGTDVMDEEFGALEKISLSLIRHGVTSFLPTTMTMPTERIRKALENIRRLMHTQKTLRRSNDIGFTDPVTPRGAVVDSVCGSTSGACAENFEVVFGSKVIGAHLEGPFLNKKYCGAQSPDDMKLPDSTLPEEFSDVVRVITIAPELEGGVELIERYGNDFLFSLGHSDCDYDTAMRAFKVGARSVTHLFNAMTPLHHRSPGLTGAALCHDEVFVEMICDNIHISPALYNLVLKCKGTDRVMLVTDCMRAGGMSDGCYELGGQPVIVREGKCTLKSGTIAGSVLTMDQALRNVVLRGGIPLEKAIPMTSCNQARYLGMADQIGSIAIGKSADFVILDDALNIVDTVIEGRSLS